MPPAAMRRVYLIALVSGVLTGLTQPLVIRGWGSHPLDPTGLSGAAVLVTMVPLFLVVRGAPAKRVAMIGFVGSYGQLFVTNHWVMYPFSDYLFLPTPVAFVIMLVLGAALVPMLALGWGAAGFIVARTRVPWWIAGPVAITAAELLRNYQPFGGDPWGTVGMSVATVDLLRQGASAVGVYGLVFAVLLINAVIAEVIARRRERFPIAAVACASLVAVTWVGWGAYRLSATPDIERSVKIAVLQGSIEQHVINAPTESAEQVRAIYHQLQDEALSRGAEIVVWPEGALVPAVDRRSPRLPTVLSSSTATAAPAAIVGAMAQFDAGGEINLHSSAFIIDRSLKVLGRFDKVHLVPLGEYVPWPLSGLLGPVVPDPYRIAPGVGFYTATIPHAGGPIRAGMTICYEGAFPEITRRYVDDGAELMVNLTNDGWFGVSSQPAQHVLMYSMRATESGRAIVRAANNGISAFVDLRGRMYAATERDARVVMIDDVPIGTETTLYQRLGEWVAAPCFALTLLLLLGAIGRRVEPWRRALPELGLVLFGAIICVGGLATVFAGEGVDEAAQTWAMLTSVWGFVIVAGARRGASAGRTAIIAVSASFAALCAIGLVTGHGWALVVGVIATVVALTAGLRRRAYKSESARISWARPN